MYIIYYSEYLKQSLYLYYCFGGWQLLPVLLTKAVPHPVLSNASAAVAAGMYGHIAAMARAVKKGVDSVEGVEGVLYQVCCVRAVAGITRLLGLHGVTWQYDTHAVDLSSVHSAGTLCNQGLARILCVPGCIRMWYQTNRNVF